MAPTMSAEVCPCGTQMEYGGENKNTLECAHCDRACTVQRDTKQPCPLCESFNEQWRKKIEESYGPGRAF